VTAFLARPAELIVRSVKSCLSVCLCVNQGVTNYNHYTHKLVILHAQTWWTLIINQKLGQSDLVYWVYRLLRSYVSRHELLVKTRFYIAFLKIINRLSWRQCQQVLGGQTTLLFTVDFSLVRRLGCFLRRTDLSQYLKHSV